MTGPSVVSKPGRMMLAVLILLALVLAVLVIALTLTVQSNQSIQTLLLNGRTASAIAARKTAAEVKTLLAFQTLYHEQSQAQARAQANGNRIIAQAIADIETHLDSTIAGDVGRSAATVEREIVRFNERVVIPDLERAIRAYSRHP